MDAESVDNFIRNYRISRFCDGYRVAYDDCPPLWKAPLNPVTQNFKNVATELPPGSTWQVSSNPVIHNFTSTATELPPRLACYQAGAEYMYALQGDNERYEPVADEVLFLNSSNVANMPYQRRHRQETYRNNPLFDDCRLMYDNRSYPWNVPPNPDNQNFSSVVKQLPPDLARYHAGAAIMDTLQNNNERYDPVVNEALVLHKNNVASTPDPIKNWQEKYTAGASSSTQGHLGQEDDCSEIAPYFKCSEKMRRILGITYADLAEYFKLPMRGAPKKLHIGPVTLGKDKHKARYRA